MSGSTRPKFVRDLLAEIDHATNTGDLDHSGFPSDFTALSDTLCENEESVSKTKEAERFELEPWPRASNFGSWKIRIRREVISGRTGDLSVIGKQNSWFASGPGNREYSPS